MKQDPREYHWLIEYIPPNNYKGYYYWSNREQKFVDLKNASFYRDHDTAKAYAEEFGLKLDTNTRIIFFKSSQ
jgi:hypothetical protein